MFTELNGHFDWTHAVTAAKHTWADLASNNPARYAYLRRLVDLGVLHDNPRAQELVEAIGEVMDMDAYQVKGYTRPLKAVLRTATHMYRAGDDFWKIIGFENERQNLLRHGMQQDQAEQMAAERVRNGYPTYSMVPESIRLLRRFPVVGTFVSFPWEILRTTTHQFLMMGEDLRAGRTDMAVRRMVGMAVATSLSAAVSYVTMSMLGMTDDDDEAVRALAPPWQRDAQLAYFRGEDGKLRYLDLSHLDPYTYYKEPFTALMNGNYEGLDEKMVAASWAFLEPFLGEEITFGAIRQVMSNKKSSGAPVYDEYAEPMTQGIQALNFLRTELQPGVFSNVERTLKALHEEKTSYGRSFDLADEGLAWVGFRMTTVEPKISLRFRAYEFGDARTAAGRPVYKAMRDPNVGKVDMGDVVSQSHNRWENAWHDMHATVRAARVVGLSDDDIRATMRYANVPKKYVPYLLEGQTPPWRPTKQSLLNARRSVLHDLDDPAELKRMDDELNRRIDQMNAALEAQEPIQNAPRRPAAKPGVDETFDQAASTVEQVVTRIDALRDQPDARQQALEANRELYRLRLGLASTQKRLRALYQRRRKIEADRGLSEAEQRALIEELEQEMAQTKRQFLRRYHELGY
jgi:hypothetical protein